VPWPDIVRVLFRRWWVFGAVFALCVLVSLQIREVGSEFIAIAKVAVISPPTDNTLLDSAKPQYISIAIIAVFEHYDDSYANELTDAGLSDDFDIDFFSEFPVVTIEVKDHTHDGVIASAGRIAQDYVDRIDSVQAERDIPEVSRLGGAVIEVTQTPNRPAGSRRAMAGLLLGSTMIAGAAAYGFDQFLSRDPVRRRDLMMRPAEAT
jgi:hypothetical protein